MSVKQVFNTSAELDYPTVLPTLDLDFANSKTLDPRITFTRASGGSYVGADGLIKYAGVNEARFDHDPVTGESLGFLVEESRTNLITYSGISSSFWSANNSAVVTDNSSTSPDGTTNATQIAGAALASSGVFKTFSLTSGTAYTYSLFVKAVSGSNTIYFGTDTGTNATVQVNTSTGVAVSNSGATVSNITSTSYPNGWYRISFTFTASVTATHSFVIYNITANANTWLAYGAQVEAGAFPTSYIPTVASTVTRSADNASMTGTNFTSWYNSTEGSVYCRYNRIGIQSASTTVPTPWGVSDGTFSNSMTLIGGYSVPSNRRFDILNSGSATAQLDFTGTETAQTFNKVCVTYKLNDIAGSYNAQTVLTDTSSNIPSVNQLCIGRRDPATLTDYLNGNISQLSYYPKRLTNSQLQNLTK